MLNINAHRRIYGQYFTPEPVVACCYELLAGSLPPAPSIADPACGDGAFLRYATTHGLAAPIDLYGCDVDAALVGTLTMAGLPNVYHGDGLDRAHLPNGAFDLVVGNPPYGVATTQADGQGLASEVRFLLRAVDLVRPGGAIALVLPSGVLANERLRAIRADLLERCTLLATIALPRTTFRRTGTTAACSVLLLRKTPAKPDHQAFFALARDLAELPAIVDAFRRRPATDDRPQTADPRTPTSFWLPQTSALAQRMDPHFWRPDFQLLLEQMAAYHTLRPLGELIGQGSLIVGDHVRPSRGEAKGPGLPYEYYQTREFLPTGYNYATIERCDERAYQRLARTSVRQHDILVSCAGVGGAGQGRVCLVTHQPGLSCTGDIFILRMTQLDPIFLFLFLGSRGGRAQLQRLQNGVGTANLSADELLQVQVPILLPATQQSFAARYTPIAAAHDKAMAALSRGDTAGFAQERRRAEALLAQLRCELEEVLGLPGTRVEKSTG